MLGCDSRGVSSGSISQQIHMSASTCSAGLDLAADHFEVAGLGADLLAGTHGLGDE